MEYFFGHMMMPVLGSNGEDNGWMQILVFVGLAVFYGLSSILKAKANKVKESDFPEEESEEKPVDENLQKKQERRFEQLSGHEQYLRKVKTAESWAGIKRKIAQFVPEMPVIQPQKPDVQIEPDKLTEDVSKPLKGFKARVPKSEELKKQPAALLDLAGSDDLVRAILYLEILGKPLALRDREQELIEF
jgi:hypothetical protein